MLKAKVITLFPEMFTPLQHSICGRAQSKGQFELELVQLRDFAINNYGTVDDYPFGGEAGLVLRPEPLADAIEHCIQDNPEQPVVYLTADGKTLKQTLCNEFTQVENITLVCGHYKGIDERIREKYITHEISIGDFVLTGGELPAMVFLDSIVRLLPEVLGNKEAAETDSFYNGLLGWPIYTRPANWEGMEVPPVLLSGHHKNIEQWRNEQALEKTRLRRPDLLEE